MGDVFPEAIALPQAVPRLKAAAHREHLGINDILFPASLVQASRVRRLLYGIARASLKIFTMSSHVAAFTSESLSKRSVIFWLGPAAVALVTALLYTRIAVDLFNDWWTQPNLSQGLLIVPFAAYIAWVRRARTLSIPKRPSPRGLCLITIACLLYATGLVGAEFFLLRISLLVLMAGFCWTFWGLPRLRTLTFAMLLLATAIPLPAIVYNSAAAPLQLLASDLAASIAQGLGVTVYRDGNIINLAHMSLGVEEACSGLNSLSAMLAASVLLGFLFCRRIPSRCTLVLLSVPVAVAANVIRVAGTAVLADYNEQFARGFYHMLAGWLIFLIGFSGLYAIAKAFAYAEHRWSSGKLLSPAHVNL